MMATALGAAVSDALDDGRVVSGVGGQYNFVAMAHALPDARSVLMLRASRDAGGRTASNIVWNYGHTTIPRHLRDVYISEYGIADVRGRSDEDCIVAMARDHRCAFPDALLDTAKRHGKLRNDFAPPSRPATTRRNTCARHSRPSAPTARCPTTRSAATSPRSSNAWSGHWAG